MTLMFSQRAFCGFVSALSDTYFNLSLHGGWLPV
jgi:hypothetical protein